MRLMLRPMGHLVIALLRKGSIQAATSSLEALPRSDTAS